ncbi:translation initiation factor IF-2 subunit alpha [Acidianus sulfidivorans JP7]|uniref:Translation initiation factor IF-2 subunit alpha n=1 Tax=Acidianus sulfidivorans JP7 TaxID=619593 RepID=A0A2U9INW0_9CREN|nr:translation initiation factor IF-2 subunit alpha [Acidianus sulfidivorans]AWR97664.1 translation initiation factor IF-2 subunit alpha [Acidianus sulfidivorans JP7]
MIYNKHSLPREGEILVATVKQVFDYGSYVTLDEYGNLQAFLPWSEISTRWVKNIRDLIKEGRKIIVKVIRVDRKKGTVDVSLKKVNDDERRKKNAQWKKIQKLDKILEIVSQKLGKSEKEAWQEVAWKLEDKYGDVFDTLIKASKEGEKILLDAGVPEIWIKPLLEEAIKHNEEKKVKDYSIITLRTLDPDGVEKIKKILKEAINEDEEGEYVIKIYTIGAPRYRIDVLGTDPKLVGEKLSKIVEKIQKEGKAEGIEIGVQEK